MRSTFSKKCKEFVIKAKSNVFKKIEASIFKGFGSKKGESSMMFSAIERVGRSISYLTTFLWLCVCACVCVRVCVCVCVCLPLSLSLSLFFSLCLSISMYIFLCVSICLSPSRIFPLSLSGCLPSLPLLSPPLSLSLYYVFKKKSSMTFFTLITPLFLFLKIR